MEIRRSHSVVFYHEANASVVVDENIYLLISEFSVSCVL